MSKTISVASIFLLIWILGSVLIAGSSLLIPLIIALFVWHLLNSMNNSLQKLPVVGEWLPVWMSMIFSLGVVVLCSSLLINIIGNNVNQVIEAAPRYQENLLRIFNGLDQRFHIDTWVNIQSMLKSVSVQGMLISFYGVFTTLTGSTVLISMYVAFLFVEQHFFSQKLAALFPQLIHRELVQNILSQIAKDTQTYLGIKTLMSLIGALASWVIMRFVGLDFAEFWALLIFFLNFIPNIGAMIATAFPAVLALIQFPSVWPFILVTSGIVIVQFIVGNIVEPRFMGKSLNLSPLVILIALGVWGNIWGVLGMFLSVPITVMMMIIFARFEKTKGIAILLSQDGMIKSTK